MGKRRSSLSEKKITEMEKEGRGQGEGANYKPWITIQDFPSHGLSTRAVGWKTNRIHHFLSKLERSYFYICEWNSDIVDIREQYPLNRIDTLHLAESKNIKHPMDSTTDVPIVMTTDFLLTVKTEQGTKFLARTIKPSNELESNRTIEKFEIEREYWNSRNVDWGIVTEKELPDVVVNNIEWLHSFYFMDHELSYSAYQTLSQQLKHVLQREGVSVIEILTQFDETYGLEDGMALGLFKHLIVRREIMVDMLKPIKTHLFVEELLLRTDNKQVKGVR